MYILKLRLFTRFGSKVTFESAVISLQIGEASNEVQLSDTFTIQRDAWMERREDFMRRQIGYVKSVVFFPLKSNNSF